MNRVNTDADSPFRGMIDFEVENDPGFLQFPGMSRLVAAFHRIPKVYPRLVADTTKWFTDNDFWLKHFYKAWAGIRDAFVSHDPKLWQEPSETNPNNLLKIVTLQEMQTLTIERFADERIALSDPDQAYQQARAFWGEFPASFFVDEWKMKGLQTDTGRKILREALIETRRNYGQPRWSYRRKALFKGDIA